MFWYVWEKNRYISNKCQTSLAVLTLGRCHSPSLCRPVQSPPGSIPTLDGKVKKTFIPLCGPDFYPILKSDFFPSPMQTKRLEAPTCILDDIPLPATGLITIPSSMSLVKMKGWGPYKR